MSHSQPYENFITNTHMPKRHGGHEEDLDAIVLMPQFAIIIDPSQVVLVRHEARMPGVAADDALLATEAKLFFFVGAE